MSLTDSQIKEGQNLVFALENELAQLKTALLSRASMRPITLWRLPLRGEEKVDLDRLTLDLIVKNRKALNDSWETWPLLSLTQLRLIKGQHPKETIRCPGVIYVPETINPVVNKVNESKAALKYYIDGIDDRDRRYLYRTIPGFNAVQALRLISLYKDLKSISYNWTFTDSITRASCSEFIQMLNEKHLRLMKAAETQDEIEQYEYNYRLDREKLDAIPGDEILAKARPVQPHFRAYVTPAAKQISCPMPVFTNNVNVNVDAKWSIATDEVNLSSLFEPTPVIEHMSIYRYKEPIKASEFKRKESNAKMRSGNYLEV